MPATAVAVLDEPGVFLAGRAEGRRGLALAFVELVAYDGEAHALHIAAGGAVAPGVQDAAQGLLADRLGREAARAAARFHGEQQAPGVELREGYGLLEPGAVVIRHGDGPGGTYGVAVPAAYAGRAEHARLAALDGDVARDAVGGAFSAADAEGWVYFYGGH